MIIEPTPTGPQSPLRRGLRLAGLVLPVALLATAVGAGFLGQSPEAASPVATGEPEAVAPDDAARGPVVAALAGSPLPDTFDGLPAISTAELLAVRSGGVVPVVVAVTGFLRVDGAADDCDALPGGPLGPWCERRGSLADRPWTSTGVAGGRQPHVHLSIPAGVRLPERVATSRDEPGEGGVRVLVVGRFAVGAEPCAGPSRACDDGFVVERFAWADGARLGLTPLVDTRLEPGTRRPNPFHAITGERTLPMAAILAWPEGVARLDPAAGAPAADGPPSEPVWYVRVLDRDGETGPGFRWLLLAERDLRVLGTGTVGGTRPVDERTTGDETRDGPGERAG